MFNENLIFSFQCYEYYENNISSNISWTDKLHFIDRQLSTVNSLKNFIKDKY
jgi:hypothetical protein